MTAGNLLPMALLRRKAVVYVRQSTTQQVNANLESQRRQYELDTRKNRLVRGELVRGGVLPLLFGCSDLPLVCFRL